MNVLVRWNASCSLCPESAPKREKVVEIPVAGGHLVWVCRPCLLFMAGLLNAQESNDNLSIAADVVDEAGLQDLAEKIRNRCIE